MKFRTITVISILLVVIGFAFSQKKEPREVPFLYKEDSQVASGDVDWSAINESDALKKDAFLQAPMTHLEYVLDRLEQRLNRESNINLILATIEKSLSTRITPNKWYPLKIEGETFFTKEGKVRLSYDIKNASTPTVPLKNICRDVIEALIFSISPYSETGPLVLSNNEKLELEKKVRDNIVYFVSVHTITDDGKINHWLRCLQPAPGAELIYTKHSYDVRKKDTESDEK